MNVHLSPFDKFDKLEKGAVSGREPKARRIGEFLSILFLASLGTVAAVTGVRADAQMRADAPVAIAASPSPTAR